MSSAPKSAQEHSALFSKKQRNIAFMVVALAFVMDLLDSTIVNIAIPTIQQNLGASYAAIQWLIAGYSLTFALLLITGGRMGDVYGYKKLFMIGVGGFTLASLLCGLSTSPAMLVIARLVQGSMAALMVPQVMSMIQVLYKPEERTAVNGMFGALGGMAATFGPIIGGLLIKTNIAGLDWRPIFLINVPVGLFALFMAQKYLPDGKSEHPLKLDLIGTAIVLVAMTLLIFPLIQGRELGWPTWTYAMLIASVPAFLLFAKWQQIKMARDGSPLVVPALFSKRSFSVGTVVNLLFPIAMISFFLVFTLMLQIGLGFSAIHAALTGLPLAVGIAATMATMGEKIIPKLGRRALMIGVLVMGLGLAIVSYTLIHYGQTLHSWQLIPGLFLQGVGMGFVFASLFASTLNDVDVSHAGAAASFDSVSPGLRAQLTSYQVPSQAQEAILRSVKQCYVDRSHQKDVQVVPASCKPAKGAPSDPRITKAITATALKANNTNFNRAFKPAIIFEGCVLGAVFVLSFLLPKRFKPEAYQAASV